MRVSFNLSADAFRPSNAVRALEDGVGYVGGKIGTVARAARNEFRARQLANATKLVAALKAEESADLAAIRSRMDELLASK